MLVPRKDFAYDGVGHFLRKHHTMKFVHLMVTSLLGLALVSTAQADTAAAKAKASMARATVVAVDLQSQRVLLSHGPIPSLHMGPMTMEFSVPDAKLLKRLKKGSKLRFTAVQQNDDYIITQLRVVK